METGKVGELIAALKEQGVARGEEEGDRIVSEAQARAKGLLEEAKAEAEALVNQAKEEAKLQHLQLQSSLEIAANQFLARLKKDLETDLLVLPLGEEISGALADEAVLRELIKTSVEAFVASGGQRDLDVLLPAGATEELKRYALGLMAGQGQKDSGGAAAADPDLKRGFALSLDGGRSRLEFSDRAFLDLFLSYLSPWFRGLFQSAGEGQAK